MILVIRFGVSPRFSAGALSYRGLHYRGLHRLLCLPVCRQGFRGFLIIKLLLQFH